MVFGREGTVVYRKRINTVGEIILDGTDIDLEQIKADKIERAMLKVFKEGKIRTRDVGGTTTTNEFADAIIGKMT